MADRFGEEVNENDDRTISDLMVDQIEFANVIVLNKTDMVSKATLHRIEAIIKQMNPKASVLQSTFSKIDLKSIMGTNLFNFDEAATNAGWLQSIHEMQKTGKKIPKPETEEYGISSFVYAARRPFHPQRLMDLVGKTFFLIENSPAGEDAGEDEMQEDACGEDVMEDDVPSGTEEEDEDEEHQQNVWEVEKRLKNKKASVFNTVLRSKGFIWLANRPQQSGEWSQAGAILTVDGGSPWFAALPDEAWPEDKAVRELIQKDFHPEVGDRRQELVFIGTHLDPDAISSTLDTCLLTDEEWLQYKNENVKSIISESEDPWAPWAIEDEHDHEHGGR